MEEPRIKSYGFNATYEFIEKNYDDAARGRILGALSPEARSFAVNAKKSQWAAPGFSAELWTGIVKEHPKDAQEQLVKVGRYQGAYATSTYLKLLMKMLTMKMFAKKLPDIWSRDANFAKISVGDLADIDKGKLAIRFDELGKFPYFGPTCQGWFSYSFEVMGLKNVKVDLVEWSLNSPDPGQLNYQITWTR
jgi:hypothetical protein